MRQRGRRHLQLCPISPANNEGHVGRFKGQIPDCLTENAALGTCGIMPSESNLVADLLGKVRFRTLGNAVLDLFRHFIPVTIEIQSNLVASLKQS